LRRARDCSSGGSPGSMKSPSASFVSMARLGWRLVPGDRDGDYRLASETDI
jgi:hypothetical protein